MSLRSQSESTSFNRFFYQLNYQPKIEDTTRIKNIFVLDISSDGSVFRDYLSISQDSLVMKGLTYLKQTGENSMEKLGVKDPIFSYVITKDKFGVFVKDVIGFDTFNYKENIIFDWKITPEIKLIMGFKCQKASVKAFGREWIAWFTDAFPYNDGPYKFHGLPGTILEVYDVDNFYHFNFIGSKINIAKQNYIWDTLFGKDIISVDKKKFGRIEEEFRHNPYSEYELKFSGDSKEKDAIKIMRQQMLKFYKKNNNPLEKSTAEYKIKKNDSSIFVVNEDGLAVSIAKVGFDDSVAGCFTDKEGKFTLPENVKKVTVEMPGYEKVDINTIDIKNSTILLVFKKRDIAEIILSPKDYRIINLGYKYKSKLIHVDYLPKDSKTINKTIISGDIDVPSSEIAIPFHSTQPGKIISINLNFAKFDVDRSIPIRFTIYSEKDGLPDQILNDTDLLFNLNKDLISDDTVKFDLSNYNLVLPNGNYFISFQPTTRDFNGSFFISGGFLGTSLQRTAFTPWKKSPAGFAPGINIYIKVEK